jgi:hypothetical protein
MSSIPRYAVVTMFALVPLQTGCGGSSSDSADASTGPADASPSCLEAAEHSDLEWIQENVITPTCAAFSACHKGAASAAGDLNLEAGMFEANVVDVPSELAPGLDLVEPGSPEDSYMMIILGHYGDDDPRIDDDVGTMPYNLPLLCQEKRDAIERWILAL